MSEFLTYLELGFRHITDVNGADHILFLLALAAIYRARDWRDAVWVVTAFTVGHSITLALAVTGVVMMPMPVIEFLIPVTIVATGIENLAVRDRRRAKWGGRYRALFAGLFGLVHGAGFANYLRALFVEDVAIPLFGFNVGIELGQLLVLTLAGALFVAVDQAIGALRRRDSLPTPARLRTIAVSALVVLVAARWAVERAPW